MGLLGAGLAAQAQPGTEFGFEFRPAAKVVQGADTLRHAWAGGMNTPQFSNIDLNNDGQSDLFVFERESSRIYTFLNQPGAGGSGRRWVYAPQYASLFPRDLNSWALLRDYDCDGRPDLFTDNQSDVRVFRNVPGPNGLPSFTLASNQIRFTYGTGSANLVVGGYNMPALADVNGDGKLDIVTYDFFGSTVMELYFNTSPGTCGGALTFTQASSYWGMIEACGGCASYRENGQPCVTVPRRPLHTPGHNILLLDLDGDGDQDVIDGLDGCPELVRLLNQGNSQTASFRTAAATASFPAASPVRINTFPAAYSVDVNFDGRADLLAAPNMLDNLADRASLRSNVLQYTNTASSGPPVFSAAGVFLQPDMLDVSEGAAPAFGDLSGDGLPDMLIGNLGDNAGGVYRASLAYYRNVGTRTQPIFSLVTNDYLSIHGLGYEGLKPAIVDLNRDGRPDLAFSGWYAGGNEIFYLLNTAAAGQPAAFNLASINTFKGRGPAGSGILPYARNDKPCFTDVDNDGYVDLLIGTNEVREPGMSLRYFRNRGRGPLDSVFVLADNDFGRIRANGARPFNLSPTVADFDGDGHPDLLTTDNTGILRMFANFRSQSNVFLERTDLLYSSVTAQYEATALGRGFSIHTNLAAADVNGDGAPELFLGLQTGGVLSYATRNRSATGTRTEAARALALSVYPNPAAEAATVETAAPTRISLLDLTGRVLRAAGPAQRRHTLALSGLAPGIYLVRAEGSDGAVAVQRLMVR
ncbi:hypothetical protein GCM10023185_38920 [Hymenobacter saemangeumensis]|uniref:Secretion system C-terminal sorting domain-containing protein n=1 Tax=Hymenobacter saemangeumensis TaxID=1084522 RepID=A0ABP8IRP6_9BACT